MPKGKDRVFYQTRTYPNKLNRILSKKKIRRLAEEALLGNLVAYKEVVARCHSEGVLIDDVLGSM